MIGRIFLGRYQVQRLLGEGGMGKVWLARQTDLGRAVVVKVMHEHIAEDPRFRERFQRETLLMARFSHPHAVALYDASLNDPLGPCIVMEYVKGVNLESLLSKSGRFSAPRVARIVGQLCEVLQAAHDEGIIHRDLKPANLMIVDPDTPRESIKVMDFGLAKLITDAPARKVTDTNVDFAVGTPGYIAPEQVRGESMDHRGDLYSVGVMAYELVTGRLPFTGANSMDVLLAHATEAPPTFRELGLEGIAPPAVERLILELLAKEPDDRPQSARELAERLDTAVEQAQTRADMDWAPPGSKPPQPMPRLADQAPIYDSGTIELTAVDPAAGRPGLPPTPPDALGFHMEAWMPEAIAMIKLRGFVHDLGGEVLESVPGLTRVRLGKGRGNPALGWLGLGRRSSAVELELQMHRLDPGPRGENNLTIQVFFRPPHPKQLADPVWRERCTTIFVELKAYLMGGAG